MSVTLKFTNGIIDDNTFGKLTDEIKSYLLKPQTRKCKMCDEIFPKRKNYFYPNNRGGFSSYCRKCDNKKRLENKKKARIKK